jgi:outer membrane protein insertion porin family
MFCRVFLALLVLWWWCAESAALTVHELDPNREWQVYKLSVSGNTIFSQPELLAAIRTKERPWYVPPWKERPIFDPTAFTTDLERLQRFYAARGYYQCTITHELQVDEEDGLVTVQIQVKEPAPVTVAEVNIEISPDPGEPEPRPLPEKLPLQPGDIFVEDVYQHSEQVLRDFFLARGHAWVKTQRKATVDLEHGYARVQYLVQPGPPAVFGDTRVEGTQDVSPALVARELTYQPGEQFSLEKVANTRDKILGLELFRSVQVAPERTDGTPRVVPMRVRVEEKPPRDIKVGLKYSTQDELGAQVEWQHHNWLGGGRQLSTALKYSSITASLGVTFVQPHFLSPRTRAVVSVNQDQEDEETFLLNATRFRPRLEHRFSSTFSGFLGYRFEFIKLNDVKSATIRALGQFKRDGVVSGPFLGVIWNTTEDPLDPKAGEIVSATVDQVGKLWGGDYRFYKLTVEGKKYQRLGWETVLAGRLKIGIADAIGGQENMPLFERFYAGGEKSVRGYGRRRLGPLTEDDDPLGGLSLIEGTLELRRPLWQKLGGALFVDFGQVSTQSLDFPFDDLDFAVGVGVSYATPIGPVRFDIGFPFDPPPGDQPWQLHFSMGQFF